MDRIPMTRGGFEKIKKEIEQIKAVLRPCLVMEIEAAMSHGDLGENAEYHAAKERLSHINGRLQHLELKLSKAEIIDSQKMKGHDRVVFGAHVTILDTSNDAEITYQIVGEDESDISSGKISVNSPVGRAMIGKGSQSIISVKTPKGMKEFEIVKIEYR